MPAVSPFVIAQKWIVSTLTADSTISNGIHGIFDEVAVEGTNTPFIVMRFQVGPDVTEVNQSRVWTACRYKIDLVIDGNDIVTVDPITAQIDNLLHKGSGQVTGGAVLACTRLGIQKDPGLEAGHEYRHIVQEYELLVQPN